MWEICVLRWSFRIHIYIIFNRHCIFTRRRIISNFLNFSDCSWSWGIANFSQPLRSPEKYKKCFPICFLLARKRKVALIVIDLKGVDREIHLKAMTFLRIIVMLQISRELILQHRWWRMIQYVFYVTLEQEVDACNYFD